MRKLLTLAALSALAVSSASVPAAFAAGASLWDHNGSKMTLEQDGEKRKLVYTEPKEGLDKAGIRPGTVLFDGKRKPDGRFAGFAKIFRGGCNPVDYFVEGAHDERKGEILLQGQAPVYGEKGCEVSGYSDTSPASMLSFSYLGPAQGSGAVARAQPDYGVEQGDRAPENDGSYLPPPGAPQDGFRRRPAEEPPADTGRGLSRRYEAEEDPLPRRGFAPDRRFGEEPERDYFPSRERRYSRAPERDEELQERRRRLRELFEPDYGYEDEEIEEDDPPPPYRYWRRRLY